ncbi:ROK family protein [Brevibacillus laterosporus GI-9]|uniref:ROK family protein n=1 Tax=Brevibacillus laterosporus TaxID=1465 RepID=UPI000240511E|nr:ROK family protein [Brevibacillus laterosporus]CCF15884.1 ROK family protein [Brevibacillus laterosporus GI-9]
MSKKVNLIKEINLNKVRSALLDVETATKSQLAEFTGLSVVTVNSLINTLMDTGEVLPDLVLHSASGRPAASFRYNSTFRLALMIYMHEYYGQDTVFYSVVNLRGEVIQRTQHAISNVNVDSFDNHIENLLTQFPAIKAICFGIPGAEVNQKIVISDYEEMREQSLSGHVSAKFHLPVLIENDINAAVMGYCHLNQIRSDECVIGLYFPDKYPPGAGIYLNGKVYKGRNGLAGEIKYFPFGVHWESFNYNSEEMEDVMFKTIQAFLCMYNPDRIVLYGANIRHRITEIIHERCLLPLEKMMLPEIITSADLNTDFEAGIKQSALSMIDTK